jgi:hypothetical protein
MVDNYISKSKIRTEVRTVFELPLHSFTFMFYI